MEGKKNQTLYSIFAVIIIFAVFILLWAYFSGKFGTSASVNIKTVFIDSDAKWQKGQLSNLEISTDGAIFIKGLKTKKPVSIEPITPSSPSASPANTGEIKLAQTSDMIRLYPKTSQSCSAYIPNNWNMQGFETRYGIGADLAASDGTMNASYMTALVVNPGSNVPGLGNYQASTPEAYIQTMLTANGISNFQYTSGPHQMDNNYKLVFWSGNYNNTGVKGFAFYTTFPINSNYYVISLRVGAAQSNVWENNKATLFDSITSVRCNKSLYPVEGGPDIGSYDKAKQQGTSGRDVAAAAEKDREAIMGYENTHSPSTGEHYQIPTSLYNEIGPDGPGYYRATGTNSYEKLNMGFGY